VAGTTELRSSGSSRIQIACTSLYTAIDGDGRLLMLAPLTPAGYDRVKTPGTPSYRTKAQLLKAYRASLG
jgi:hypothetical protein